MSVIQMQSTNISISASSTSTIILTWPVSFGNDGYAVSIQNPLQQLGSSLPLPATVVSWTYLDTPSVGSAISVVISNPNSGGTINAVLSATGILPGVQDDLTNFLARLSAIDGIGLSNPSTGDIPVIESDINGLRTTLSQVVLTIQSQLNAIQNQVNNIQTTVNLLTNH